MKSTKENLLALGILISSFVPVALASDPISGGGGGGLGGGNQNGITYACIFNDGSFFRSTAPTVAAAEAFCASFPNSQGIVY